MARNFVPAGEDNADSKRPFGVRSQNFVPGPDHELGEKLTADEQMTQAELANIARTSGAKQRSWDEAVHIMRTIAPQNAVTYLRGLATNVRELYLLAEMSYSNRSDILAYFPAPGPTAQRTWKDYAVVPKAEPAKAKSTPTTKGTKHDS